MTSLLEKWLYNRVGYCVRLDPKNAGLSLFDGRVFYELLKTYGIVEIEMFGGIPGRGRKSPEEAFRWLKLLSGAFCLLKIQVDDDYLRAVAKRNGPLAIRLLTQLYLKIQDKTYLDLLKTETEDKFQKKTKEEVLAMCKKFKRRALAEGDSAAKQMAKISLYEETTKKVRENCKSTTERNKVPTKPPPMIPLSKDEHISEIQKLTEEYMLEEDFDFNSAEYMKALKSAARRENNRVYQLSKTAAKPAGDCTTDALSGMGEEFSTVLTTGMNQQSHFEKYEATKWSKAHHTLARFFEAGLYKYVDSDEETDPNHIVQNKILREGGEAIAKKQEPTWALHKKLYAKRIKLRKRSNFEMCRHVVQDLIDVLMKVLLYRYEHKRVPIPRKVMNEWKEAFWKCQLTCPPKPLLYEDSSLGEEEFVLDEDDFINEYSEFDDIPYTEIILDQPIVQILHEYDLHCYMYMVGPWDIDKWPEWKVEDENLMVNGFIVHRLLQTKYPLPKGYQDPKFDFKYKAAMNSLKDTNSAYIYNTMRNLLTKQKVAVLDVIEPMNYCLSRYNMEISDIGEQKTAEAGKEEKKRSQAERRISAKKASESGKEEPKAEPKPKNESRKSMGAKKGGSRKSTSGARKSKTGARKSTTGSRKSLAKGSKSDAGGRKSNAGKRKSSVGGRKSIGGKKSVGKGSIGKAKTRVNDKSVQCPSVDELISRVKHTPAGLLGKEAFIAMNEGRPVGDLLSGKMLIEYLKAKRENIVGFALLSYPLTVSQAVLLEFLLTGRPIKTDHKVSPEVAKFIHDELRPQPYIDTRLLVDFEGLFDSSNDRMGKEEIEELEGFVELPAVYSAVNALELGFQQSGIIFSPSKGLAPREGIQGKETEKVAEKLEYPYWNLKQHNLQQTEAQLRQQIINDAYNLGRFRPYISEETYEKMKAHILCLIAWLRTRKKFQTNPCNDLDQLYGEGAEFETETVEEEKRAIFGMPDGLKLEEYKRPVTYTQILKLRSSEIMPRPNKSEMEIHFTTTSFFQKFIKCLPEDAAKKEEAEYQARKEKYDKIKNEELPEEENFVLDPITEENPDSFYKVYGTKQICDYNRLDYDSITKICRMMIGAPWDEDDLQRKRSVELFDIETLRKLNKDMPGRKRKKTGKSSKGRKSKAGGRKSKAGGRKSRASKSPTRKSKSSTGRKSTASKRQSKAAGNRQSMKRKSTAKQGGGSQRKSVAGKGLKKGSKSGPGKTPVSSGKEESETEEEFEQEEVIDLVVLPVLPKPPPPKPGEFGWEYVNETISDIYQIYLATVWESIEFEYLANLRQIFSSLITHDNKVIPYRDYVRAELERFLGMTDERMEAVDVFQKEFNSVKSKLRHHTEMKRSMHCKIFALYNDLVELADEKRGKAFARREELIRHRWVPKHLFTLANFYRSLIQTEVNRTIHSLQLLHDYYFAMLQKPPTATRLELLTIDKVFPLKRAQSLMSDSAIRLDTDSKADQLRPESKSKLQDNLHSLSEMTNIIDNILYDFFAKNDPTPVYPLISNSIALARAKNNDLFDYYEKLILDPELGKELRPQVLRKLTPEEEKARRKQEKEFRKMLERRKQVEIVKRTLSESLESKPKKVRKKKKPINADEEYENEEEELTPRRSSFHIDASQLQLVDKLKWEWLVAVQNEIARLYLRLDLIENRGKGDLEEVLSIMKAVFNEFFHDVGWQYRREMRAIEDAVNMFKAATDQAVDIPVQMNLDNDRFYLCNPENSELFSEPPPPPNSPAHQVPDEYLFTMRQLENFVRKIEEVSPNGMLDGCLVEILEDMVTYNAETNGEFLPPGWNELTRRDILFLMEQIFGTKTLANWREFLLYCMVLEYPTLEEMVEMRMRFRECDVYENETVDYASYMRIPLWFEHEDVEDDELLRRQELKNILFKLFRTARKELNYTDLLISLCKGREPEEGLGKALGLMEGIGYIFWPDPPDYVHPRLVVDYVLNQILHDVIIRAHYVTITEIFPEVEILEEYLPMEEQGEEEYLMGDEVPVWESEEFIEEEEEFIDKYKQIIWRSCVPYEMCLRLLFAALRFTELPASQLARQLDVEARLRKLFDKEGVGTHLKAYKLGKSKLMDEIFQTTCAFRECNVPELVYCIIKSKHHVIGARETIRSKII